MSVHSTRRVMEFAKVIERYDPHHNQDHERVRDKLRVHGPIDGLISAQHLRVLACHVSNIASQGANPNFSNVKNKSFK